MFARLQLGGAGEGEVEGEDVTVGGQPLVVQLVAPAAVAGRLRGGGERVPVEGRRRVDLEGGGTGSKAGRGGRKLPPPPISLLSFSRVHEYNIYMYTCIYRYMMRKGLCGWLGGSILRLLARTCTLVDVVDPQNSCKILHTGLIELHEILHMYTYNIPVPAPA